MLVKIPTFVYKYLMNFHDLNKYDISRVNDSNKFIVLLFIKNFFFK
jgi:hypothetical protein